MLVQEKCEEMRTSCSCAIVAVDMKDDTMVDDEEKLIHEKKPPKGCWNWFTSFLGGMWATKDMNNTDDREIFIRTTIRELIVYSIFLTVLCICELLQQRKRGKEK